MKTTRRRAPRWLRRAFLCGGGAAAGYALLGAGLAWKFLYPGRTLGQGTPADYDLEYETVILTASDGVRLKGWYVPCPEARAGIVLCHGYRANRGQFARMLTFLHRAGFTVLAFDFRAMGESEGRRCSFGHVEKGDVRAAARFLRERAKIESGRIGALGLSMGGASAILAAAEDPEIGAVVADSAFARLDQMVVQRLSHLGRASGPVAGCTQWWAERIAGFPARAVAPADVAARLSPRPLLLIHGDADTYTPLSQAQALYAAAAEPKQLWIVPGAAHVRCHDTAEEKYERRVAGFFREALLNK